MASEEAAPISLVREQPIPFGQHLASLAPQSVHQWIAAFTGLFAFALVAAAGASYYLKIRLDALAVTTSTIARQTTELAGRVDDLGLQATAIKSEGTELRQYVASSSAEQVIFLKILVLRPDIDPVLARTIAKYARHYAALYKRDPDLVLAIIAEESRFNPNAVSNVGAMGLMQVMPHWEKVLGIQGSLKDPETSIKYGLQVLGFYLEMYKDVEMALTAYNRGPGPVDAALVRGKDPNNGYAPQVLKVYDRLKKLTVPPGA